MNRSLTFAVAAGLALLTAPLCGADENNAVIHNEPITVRILSGKDGHPLPHAHLIFIAGYDQRDIAGRLWQEETLTDEQGRARLSKQLANLPWLQVWVNKKSLCQENPRQASFSVERIRRDGLSSPNRCGIATVEDAPGVFTVFVKTKGADLATNPPLLVQKTQPPAPVEPAKRQEQAQVKLLSPIPTPTLPQATLESLLPTPSILSLPAVTTNVRLAAPPTYGRARRVAARRRAHRPRPRMIACQAPPASAKTEPPAKATTAAAPAKTSTAASAKAPEALHSDKPAAATHRTRRARTARARAKTVALRKPPTKSAAKPATKIETKPVDSSKPQSPAAAKPAAGTKPSPSTPQQSAPTANKTS
jgi:hypothetical protein